MGFNLPPGVSVRDIPGNRPIDSLWEGVLEDTYALTVEDFEDKLKSDAARDALRNLIDAVVENEVESLADYLDGRDRDPED